MDLYSVNAKPFRRSFILMELYSAIAIITSFLLARAGIFFIPMLGFSRKITFPLLLLMFLVSVWYGRSLRKRIGAVGSIQDFEARVQEYEKAYRFRLQWNLISCLILCVMFVLTERYFFFYFAIFHIVLGIPLYPNATLFKRELKNEEVILY